MKTLRAEFNKHKANERLHQLPVPIVALTGGISSGKSTVSKLLIQEGIPLIDADQLVKDVYELPETIKLIKEKYPEAWKNEQIHFPTLREKFFKDELIKKELEDFIYKRLSNAFLNAYKKLGSPSYVVYDVPLLFEKNLESKVDFSVLVYAPRKIQRERLMKRDGLLEDMAETILDQQMDIELKKSKANFLIDNSQGLEELKLGIQSFIRHTFAFGVLK